MILFRSPVPVKRSSSVVGRDKVKSSNCWSSSRSSAGEVHFSCGKMEEKINLIHVRVWTKRF